MKYLRLFERFDSKVLSGVFKFIDDNSKKKFVSDLLRICKDLNLPASYLSEDHFQIMNYINGFNHNKENFVKFWFNSSGYYIGVTNTKKVIKRCVNSRQVRENFAHLEPAKISFIDGGRKINGIIYLTKYDAFFIHSDPNDGRGTDPGGEDWKKYGNRSWLLS